MEQLQNLLKNKIKDHKKIFFLFDYDGTLVPIQKDPSKAILPKKTKDCLIKLSRNKMFNVALISGRAVSNLKKLTGINSRNIIFVGSHGLEFIHKSKKSFLSKITTNEIKKIKIEALRLSKLTASGFLEYKPYSFAYHIRDKRRFNHVSILYKALHKLLIKHKLDKKLEIMKGKNIVEILPTGISKGNAVKKIVEMHPDYFFIYFGDDITDISAMEVIDQFKGISVSLNEKLDYNYKYFLSSSKELFKLISAFK